MPMNSALMAKEILDAIGGEATDARKEAMEKMCQAIVLHIQTNASLVGPVLPGLATGPGGGPVLGNLATGPGVIK
jgi:hypothetical protein